jgi:tripartite-type tricarboxylate transporter receptor subunit TctC
MKMRTFARWGLALAALLAAGAAQAFPDRPVQIIVPWAAGGGTDTVTRIFSAAFEQELKVTVNVINRPGGNGLTGHTTIAMATPDGYTLGVASPEIAFYRILGAGDLTPASVDLFSRLSLIPAGVTVRADAPYATLADFLKAVKDNPKGALMASGTGVGGSWHIAAGGLLKAAGIEADRLRWVPSQGGAPALQDVMAGGITAFTGSPIEAKSLLEGGRVKTLALMTADRPSTFPRYRPPGNRVSTGPTRTGSPFVAPKNVPTEHRTALYEAARRAMARTEVQDAMKARGIQPVWDAPGAFDAYLKSFVERGNAVLVDLGLAKSGNP